MNRNLRLNRVPMMCFAALVVCLGIAVFRARSADAALTTAVPAAEVEITAANVYEHEVYWPNIVALKQRWQPPGADRPLEESAQGVLVRVEPEGEMRVDFGRHGKFQVPIQVSDLVERANGVRSGTLHKSAPNFLLQIGTRLIDSSGEEARALESVQLARAQQYLVVFADPTDGSFWEMADRLFPLREESGLQAIFVPQSVDRADTQSIKDKLRSSGWTMPYTYPRLSETYTQSLLGGEPTEPWALLVTAEGRVLHRSALARPDLLQEIRKSLLR